MSSTRSKAELIYRRAELLAELFLEELNPEFVARSISDIGYDFLVGFRNGSGGINNIAVEVKSAEKPVPHQFRIERQQYERWVHSNIPVLLLVIDVKENRLFYAWLSGDGSSSAAGRDRVLIDLTEVDESTKKELRRQFAH